MNSSKDQTCQHQTRQTFLDLKTPYEFIIMKPFCTENNNSI